MSHLTIIGMRIGRAIAAPDALRRRWHVAGAFAALDAARRAAEVGDDVAERIEATLLGVERDG